MKPGRNPSSFWLYSVYIRPLSWFSELSFYSVFHGL